jgi:hypothetical protein
MRAVQMLHALGKQAPTRLRAALTSEGRGIHQRITPAIAPAQPQPSAAPLVTLPTVTYNKQSPEALALQTFETPATIHAPARFHHAE